MSDQERSTLVGLKRGIARRCPNCGEGHLMAGYLKIAPRCDACGFDNSLYRTDDGPAYFTILIIGHLLVAPLLCFPFIWQANPLLVLAITLPLVATATLGLLGVVKGAVAGVQWASGGVATQ
jgi:uncharacterized protein (DUF983 family)